MAGLMQDAKITRLSLPVNFFLFSNPILYFSSTRPKLLTLMSMSASKCKQVGSKSLQYD